MMPPSTTPSNTSTKHYSMSSNNHQIPIQQGNQSNISNNNNTQRIDVQPIQQPGHRRDILDKIRDSLKPYEQQEKYEIQMFGAISGMQIPSTSFPLNSYSVNANGVPEKPEEQQMQMISQLTQQGFDKESAYYALKLVNFKSVMDAATILNKVKHDIALKQMNGHQQPQQVQQQNTSNITTTTFFTSPIRQPTTSASQQQQRLPRYTNVSSPVSSTSSKQQSSSYLNVSKSQTPDDSRGSSRSESPNAPVYSPTTAMGWNRITIPPSNQNLPMRPDYHSSHAKISLKHTTSIDPHSFVRSSPITSNNRGAALTGMTSAPLSSMVISIEQNTTPQQQAPRRTNLEGVPVIRTRFDRPQIQQQQQGSDPRRVQVHSIYSRNVLDRSQQNAVQSIIVDPDRGHTTNFVNYEDQICLKMSRLGKERDSGMSSEHMTTGNVSPAISSGLTSPVFSDKQRSPDCPKRSSSPLPESVSRKLKTQSYERFVKPCKPGMYRFFMEQHIDSIIKQFEDRNQRASQLLKEMEAAELNGKMQDKMLRLLRQKESRYIRLRRQKMNKDMFDIIKYIGVGAFGKVALVRKKDTLQCYAMKILSKEDVIQKQQAAHVKAERDILAEAKSDWIVKLFFSFQDSRHLYFIMDYVPGGDMMQLLINKGVFTESLARFYIAELTCAIEYVHGLGFIHRDIKPDNILIDSKGHIKLTDFGLCTGLRWTHDKRHYRIYEDGDPNAVSHFRDDSLTITPRPANENGKLKLLEYRHHKKRNEAHSVVGTGNYMAPEVILRKGHTQTCDWWSVGVILYEMVFGRPPFMSQTEDPGETQMKIVNWKKYLDLTCMAHLPVLLTDNCVDMIARLCCEENERICAPEIKQHPWFKGINFETLRSSRAEYIPTVKHAFDTSNFDTTDLDQFKKETLKSHKNFNPAFFDFTFRHFFDCEPTSTPRAQTRPSIAPLMEAQANARQAAAAAASTDLYESKEAITTTPSSSAGTPFPDKQKLVKEKIRYEPPLPAKPSSRSAFGRQVVVRSQQRGQLRHLFRQPDPKNDDEKYQQRL